MAEMERMNNHRRGRQGPRYENDFTPGTVNSRPTKQLEFHQAMTDFKRMFPTMDEEVIEAVLRANNGIVDATIDQLLTMNVDNEVFPEDLQWEDEAALAAGLPFPLEQDCLPPKRSLSEKAPLPDPIGESPPPYSEAVQSPQMLISPSIRKTVKSSPPNPPIANLLDLGIDELALSNTEPKTPISSWSSPVASANPPWHGPIASSGSTWSHSGATEKSSWKGPSSALASRSWSMHGPADHTSRKLHGRSLSMGSATKKASYRNWNPPMLGRLPDDFLRLSPTVSPQRSPSSVTTTEKSQHRRTASQPRILSNHSHQFSSDMLQERIKENERRRRMASSDLDPELAQYLEDERLALMFQNSEFLQELRDNEDFMNTLERDRMNAVAFEPAVTPVSPDRDAMMEGYGDDRDDTLEAFPFSQQLPKGDDEDAELRRKLKHMGKASRKQFASLARKFFSRKKKKSSKQIIREKLAPSRMNLLEEDSDVDGGNSESHLAYDEGADVDTMSLPPASVPRIRTVQRPPYHPDTIITYNPDSSHRV
ncbi:CUE domain-containing protein 1-like [Haliotis cracherodii]|uniref:CUE domain-containing protein 1-like n=1 Tax=Haliotis cracherodii TaxID=6455 RepID=UPI0039E7BD81